MVLIATFIACLIGSFLGSAAYHWMTDSSDHFEGI